MGEVASLLGGDYRAYAALPYVAAAAKAGALNRVPSPTRAELAANGLAPRRRGGDGDASRIPDARVTCDCDFPQSTRYAAAVP